MHRSSRSMRSDEGSAALEFIVVGVILLVPLVYLVIALGAIQEAMLGTESAARHLARVIATAPNAESAAGAGDEVLAGIIDEYGLDAETVEVTLSCSPRIDVCPSAGITVVVTVVTEVRLPLVPPLLDLDRSTAVPVQAEAAQKLSPSWGGG